MADPDTSVVIGPEGLEDLVEALARRGYRVLGPQVRDGAIVLGDLASAAELPIGWGDEQEAGHYRLHARGDAARFGHAVGAHAFKSFLFPPRVRLWRGTRTDAGTVEVDATPDRTDPRPLALIGVRGCDLAAIAIQDRVFTGGRHVDADYAARRAGAFVVAVNCTVSAATCFCVSMGTGPRCEEGYDLVLTELLEGEHRLLVRAGTPRGAEVLAEIAPQRQARPADATAAADAVDAVAGSMARRLDTAGLPELLAANLEHPRWDDVAARCLSCGNCTLVCPTCFCSSVEDASDLTGNEIERSRVWDTCFSIEYSHIHGADVRTSTRARYRQWMTHKLGTWVEQFGTSGCVGCGRCITWCPAGIDLTAEAAAIRGKEPGDAG